MSVEAGTRYSLSLYLRVPEGAGPSNATVSLLAGGDEAGGVPLASASFTGLTLQWQRYRAELASSATDHQARLAVRRPGRGVACAEPEHAPQPRRCQEEGDTDAPALPLPCPRLPAPCRCCLTGPAGWL